MSSNLADKEGYRGSSRTIWEATMSQFQLFDSVKLKEEIPLNEGGSAPEGTLGAIVEVFKNGEAYMVELFGGWVKADVGEDCVPVDRDAPNAFMETIGLETVHPQQLRLVKPARETVGVRAQLLALMDELPDNTLEEVKNFAEFLQQKRNNGG
jgi:hypothetical protein